MKGLLRRGNLAFLKERLATIPGARPQARATGLLVLWTVGALGARLAAAEATRFDGQFFAGTGHIHSLQLLDISRRMFGPDPEFQNVSMLYMPAWNGLVEGPTWDAWWIQNSYGTTYCALPFLQEPFITFIENSHELWFSQMGDGQRVGAPPPFDWVAPDGALCDAARPGWIVYKQGDGRTALHDWGLEFTAAGLLLQAELLLIGRDAGSIARNLPRLERCAAFIETRRDPANDLFLAGPAANLLAPSYAGWKRPDGTYGPAYLAGLSVTYVAALDRLIEVEKLAGRTGQADAYTRQRDSAKAALDRLSTDQGYFIRSLDPDGVRHGVYGAARHGYFESSPNHDAICFRVVEDERAERIYAKIASIPELRPHHVILPNYPSYDDMYERPEGLWTYGTWVNGGHWSTCEARMIMAYFRLGQHDAAQRSLEHLLTFARRFRMDNPLVKRGSDVYQPREAINLTYDAFGPPAAWVRGLFEYLYTARGLTVIPHIPPGVQSLQQRFPIRLGSKRLFLSTQGQGAIAQVRVDGKRWTQHDGRSVFLPYDALQNENHIQIFLGEQPPSPAETDLEGRAPISIPQQAPSAVMLDADLTPLLHRQEWLQRFLAGLTEAGLDKGYEAAHTRLALAAIDVIEDRRGRLRSGALGPLPPPARVAADQLYVQTALRLADGLDRLLHAYGSSDDSGKRRVASLRGK